MFRISPIVAIGLAAAGCATTAAGPTASETRGPGKPSFLAADFENATAAEIDERLGAPALTRVEGDGEFRRYTLARCALIVILYPDDNGVRRAETLHAGALVSGEEAPALDQCLAAGRAG